MMILRRLFSSLQTVVVIAALLATIGVPRHAQAQDQDEVSDSAITDAVEVEFQFDPAVPLNDIDVQTNDGIVQLDGTVSNLLARKRAARLAETIRGVRAVTNELTVDPYDEPTDARLRQSVEDALDADPATNSYDVSVMADGGTVRLSGSVDSWAEKMLSEKVAAGVNGVRTVENDLFVKYDLARTDPEITAEIEERMRWDALVNPGLIDVAVYKGAVTLTGTVGSAAERRQARFDAWVNGVTSVDTSGLTVDAWAKDVMQRNDATVLKSDAAILEAVQDALGYDSRVSRFDVSATVDEGLVTLRGTVDNLLARNAAARDARNTVGVARVHNRIKVRPAGALSDAAVRDNVSAALQRDPFVERYEIAVKVYDGVAYLYGTVDTFFEKGQAEDVASGAFGVKNVRNHLDVEFPDTYSSNPYVDEWPFYEYPWYTPVLPYPAGSDSEITERIDSQLFWSPFVNADEVTVTVNDGIATLTGTVDSWREYRAATENAYEGGAASVINNLRVAD